eukprot:TRINITY_DN5864_c0_g1_i4.p1 TRINITY_DN5864_c0_g1~~TRINITY_DN5864_c0_g1_i4.p1  ORF type:complete len:487 (-),score=135.46 TRINITY_DN5864_c0_g1_i4:226-1686(-)
MDGRQDNYDNMDMEMSDNSDGEMFACKAEHKAMKDSLKKSGKKKDGNCSEYGGGNEYGGGEADEYGGGGGSSEYGSGAGIDYGGGSSAAQVHDRYTQPPPAIQRPGLPGLGGTNYSIQHEYQNSAEAWKRPSSSQNEDRSPSPTPAKIEKKAELYKDKSKEKDSHSSREKDKRSSRDRDLKDRDHHREKDRNRRSRSRSKGRKRSRSRDRDRRDRRSRSRSRERRDFKTHHPPRRGRDWRDADRRGKYRGDRGGDRSERFGQQRDEHRKNIEEQFRKAEEMGVEIPKYLKPGAVNPLSYAEQVQKRKMLWKKSDPESGDKAKSSNEGDMSTPKAGNQSVGKSSNVGGSGAPSNATSFNKWEATNFGDDAANEKFRRLMGIKSAAKPEDFKEAEAPGKDSEKIMSDLQRNYDVARQQTHRNRGIGLGFSNSEPMASQYGAPPSHNHPHQHPHAQQQQHHHHYQHQQQQSFESNSRPSYGISFVRKNT